MRCTPVAESSVLTMENLSPRLGDRGRYPTEVRSAVNPYSPNTVAEPLPRGPHLAIAWNLIIGLAVARLSWLCFDLLHSHYESWIVPANGLPGAWPPFLAICAQDVTVFCGLAMFLLAVSTIRLHFHPRSTRCLAILVCVFIWFDFSAFAFTRELAARSGLFAAMVFPAILFGCGYPHLLSSVGSHILGKTADNHRLHRSRACGPFTDG